MTPGELGAMIADAITIADSCARADIECNCHISEIGDERWHDTGVLATIHGYQAIGDADPETASMIRLALRYLDARGLVIRHPGKRELVRFPEAAA